MLRFAWITALLLFVAPLPALAADEVLKLFNGKDLTGWEAEGDKEYKDTDGQMKPVWIVQDGNIVCTVNNHRSFGFLRYSAREFDDFLWHLDYRMVAKSNPKDRACNSGVGIRTRPFDPRKSVETRPSYYSYEIQLMDDAGAKPSKGSTCSLYRYVAPSANASRPAGEWNTLEIECIGPRIRITHNGQKVIDVDQSTIAEIKNKPLKGFLCLQNHGSKIEFRNLWVREIKANEKK
jgi:hypothetical protein